MVSTPKPKLLSVDSPAKSLGDANAVLLLLTPRQAAEALAISPRKLWGMTSNGEIPSLKIGRQVRYPIDDMKRWIDAQKKGGE